MFAKRIGTIEQARIEERRKKMEVFRIEGPFDPLARLKAKALEYADGTRLDVKNEVVLWFDKGKSRLWSRRVMAFVGPAGYGKSVIMAYLAVEGGLINKQQDFSLSITSSPRRLFEKKSDSTKQSETPGFTVGAAHLFRHDDANSVRVCFLSIANQLADTVPGLKEELLKLNQNEIESMTDLKVLFRSLLCAPMMRVQAPQEPIVVLLDALDEAKVDEKKELVEIITTMWESETPQWLGVIVSSRPQAFIKDKFEIVHVLRLDSKENLKDLNTFLRQRLERCMRAEENVDNAVKRMARTCGGHFLFAGFVGKMLHRREEHSLTLRDVTLLVEEFPSGLESVYRDYFTRFLQGPLENNYDQYQKLLSAMVAARSPLDSSTVASLLELESENIDALLLRVEYLLVVEQGRVHFVHKSMCTFLQDKRWAGRVAEKEPFVGGKPLSISVQMGHKWLTRVVKANPLSPFALEQLIYYLCREKDWEGVRSHLLDFNWVHAAVSLPGVAQRLKEDTDMLYNYKPFSDINVTDVIRAIELGKRAIERDPNSLAFQLMGRIPDRSHPILSSLAASAFAKSDVAKQVYVPLRATLESARSPLRKILEGHSDQVLAVAIDVDTVASGSRDETVRLWDRRSGKCLQVLEGHSSSIVALAIDEDTVVSGSDDETVRLWDRQYGICLRVLEGHSCSVIAVALVGDSVLSVSIDRTVRSWDRRSGECLQVVEGNSFCLQAVAIDIDTLVSGSGESTVQVWDRRSGEWQELDGHYATVSAVALGGDTVVSGTEEGTVGLWDRQSGKCLQTLNGHSSFIHAVAMHEDTVVSGSGDKTVRLWDRGSGKCLQVLDGHSSSIYAVAMHGDTVVSGSGDKTVRLWDRRNEERFHKLESHSSSTTAVAMDGDTVVSGSWDKTARLWNRRSGECLHVLEGHFRNVSAVAIDGDTVVSGSWDKTVRLWDRRSGQCLHVLEGHFRNVSAVALDCRTVVSGSWDKTVRLWDRESGESLQVLEGNLSFIDAVAVEGDTVVSGSRNRTVQLWDRLTGECLRVLEGHSLFVLAVAIDGDTVVSGADDKTVRLWDRLSGECLQVLKGHFGWVRAVAIDGNTVVSGCEDNSIRVWDRTSGECLQLLLFSSVVDGVAVGNVEGHVWIVVSDSISKAPHILTPLSNSSLMLKSTDFVG